jgi:hypothetical protein
VRNCLLTAIPISTWKGVYDVLVKDGYNVSIVQEPERSFQDDVTAVKRILAMQDGPSILVAHSYGGAVITEAGTGPFIEACKSADNSIVVIRSTSGMDRYRSSTTRRSEQSTNSEIRDDD